MPSARDPASTFERAGIESSWTIASSDLSVFLAGLRASGRKGVCLWFEGQHAPQDVAFKQQILDCVVVGKGDRLELFKGGKKVGDAYGMPGWVGPSVETIGWLAMIDADRV
jgi:hypothetical protein